MAAARLDPMSLLNLAGSVVGTLVGAAILGGVGWVAYFALTLPLRRRERARLFLSVLERGLWEGRSIEHTVVSLSARGVGAFGAGLHLVAQDLAAGATLAEAAASVPGFLPTRVVEMLAAGERVGDVARVLPACRRSLDDALSRTRGATHYLILAVLGSGGLFFGTLAVMPLIGIYIVPRFQMMWDDMGLELPTLLVQMMSLVRNPLFYGALWLIPLGIAVLALFYIGGPAMMSALHLRRLASWWQRAMPWRWKRVQRDFSAMLGVLLDAGVPEAEAVELAARSTGNTVFARRAERVAAALSDGAPLTEAVARLDDSGEFRWRLANAAHAGSGFSAALAGWHESLDARAFQQEQAAAQAITAAVILLDGAIVGAFAIGVFQVFSGLMMAMGASGW